MRALRPPADVNLEAAFLLQDVALAHPGSQARFAYRRAARAVLGLDRPIASLARDHELRSVPGIGIAIERLLLEFLEHGRSRAAERMVAESGRLPEIAAARALRRNFLSRAAALEILRAGAPGLVARRDLHGDLQMHSTWSDGSDPIAALANAAEGRGYRYLAVTDHSYGLRIARGISMDDVARQHEEIHRVNAALRGRTRVMQGIEANIRPDGTVDLEPHELKALEIVVAAPHSGLRRAEDQTARMLTAVRTPGIHVLGHPRGRMLTRRGILADWDAVFHEAARRHVAIELDGDPWRQDLDWTLARRALRAGCLFALDSDAHSADDLDFADWAVAHARLAGIPRERVVNAWPLDDFADWAASRRIAQRRRRRTLAPEPTPTNGHGNGHSRHRPSSKA